MTKKRRPPAIASGLRVNVSFRTGRVSEIQSRAAESLPERKAPAIRAQAGDITGALREAGERDRIALSAESRRREVLSGKRKASVGAAAIPAPVGGVRVF